MAQASNSFDAEKPLLLRSFEVGSIIIILMMTFYSGYRVAQRRLEKTTTIANKDDQSGEADLEAGNEGRDDKIEKTDECDNWSLMPCCGSSRLNKSSTDDSTGMLATIVKTNTSSSSESEVGISENSILASDNTKGATPLKSSSANYGSIISSVKFPLTIISESEEEACTSAINNEKSTSTIEISKSQYLLKPCLSSDSQLETVKESEIFVSEPPRTSLESMKSVKSVDSESRIKSSDSDLRSDLKSVASLRSTDHWNRTISILSHGPRPEFSVVVSNGMERQASSESRATISNRSANFSKNNFGSNFRRNNAKQELSTPNLYFSSRRQTSPVHDECSNSNTNVACGLEMHRRVLSAPTQFNNPILRNKSDIKVSTPHIQFVDFGKIEDKSEDTNGFFSTSSSLKDGVSSKHSSDPDSPPVLHIGESIYDSQGLEKFSWSFRSSFSLQGPINCTHRFSTTELADTEESAAKNSEKLLAHVVHQKEAEALEAEMPEYPDQDAMRSLIRQHSDELHKPARKARSDHELRVLYGYKDDEHVDFIIKNSNVFSDIGNSKSLSKADTTDSSNNNHSREDEDQQSAENKIAASNLKFAAQVIGDTVIKGDIAGQKGLVFTKRKSEIEENADSEGDSSGVMGVPNTEFFFSNFLETYNSS